MMKERDFTAIQLRELYGKIRNILIIIKPEEQGGWFVFSFGKNFLKSI